MCFHFAVYFLTHCCFVAYLIHNRVAPEEEAVSDKKGVNYSGRKVTLGAGPRSTPANARAASSVFNQGSNKRKGKGKPKEDASDEDENDEDMKST